MPSLIEGNDRLAVKRAVPKASNKIHAAGIAKLYVAYPDRQRWTATGLQGAVVLANDLVGNTFWLKMVDISPANRGVIWDQEIYDTFTYNQDRIFFHSFELEGCLAGLSFVDDKEAKTFKKKMDEREKNAHKNTRAKPFGAAAGQGDDGLANGKSHSRLGGFGRSLLGGHRHSSASHSPAQSIIPPRELTIASPSSPAPPPIAKDNTLDTISPELLKELKGLGLSEDQLLENADFIQMYIAQQQANAATVDRRQKGPPPAQPLTPQDTGNTSRRGPPPAPPPARRARPDGTRPPSPPPDEDDTRSIQRPAHSTFRVPAFADAGKLSHEATQPPRRRADSGASQPLAHPGPPPPPRPPKTPLEDEGSSPLRFGVPPPFSGERKPVPAPSRGPVPPPPPSRNTGPPPPPARDTGPPPPPSRDTSRVPPTVHAVAPAAVPPPPLPPKTPHTAPPVDTHPLPPPLPPTRDAQPSTRDARAVPPPPLPPTSTRQAPVSNAPPPPPPPPSTIPLASGGPPPPPMPSTGSIPPPPPPPPGLGIPPGMEPATANAPPLPSADGRGGLLADIRGGARLKKVSEADKSDRSSAVTTGSTGSGGAGASASAATPTGGDQGGLAGALAQALAQRKSKVSHSDDEDDKDDW